MKRCRKLVTNKTGKQRVCKRRASTFTGFCYQHQTQHKCPNNEEFEEEPYQEIQIGTCCWCKGECNAASQTCGVCARLPYYELRYFYDN